MGIGILRNFQGGFSFDWIVGFSLSLPHSKKNINFEKSLKNLFFKVFVFLQKKGFNVTRMRSRSGTFALICFDGAVGAANFRVGIVDSFKWFESN